MANPLLEVAQRPLQFQKIRGLKKRRHLGELTVPYWPILRAGEIALRIVHSPFSDSNVSRHCRHSLNLGIS